jgi:mannose-6-phosphate isomerase-like protein (cupin superfamily)
MNTPIQVWSGCSALTSYHPPMFDPTSLDNLPENPDVIAPDGSEIRFLRSPDEKSSMVHALLHPGTTTHAVHHTTVEEAWLCVAGEGELWRSNGDGESVINLTAGVTCEIPLGTIFQFRATGDNPLEIVITTTPPWPGDHEAVRTEGKWLSSV